MTVRMLNLRKNKFCQCLQLNEHYGRKRLWRMLHLKHVSNETVKVKRISLEVTIETFSWGVLQNPTSVKPGEKSSAVVWMSRKGGIWWHREPEDKAISRKGSLLIFQAKRITNRNCGEGIYMIMNYRLVTLRAQQALKFYSEVILRFHRKLEQLVKITTLR